MSIYSTLQGTHLPVAYSHFRTDQSPPYLVYTGNGQDTFQGDNTHYWRENRYQVEYYFTTKDESNEAAIEDALLADGYLYDKSEDIYIEDEDVFVIYYYV